MTREQAVVELARAIARVAHFDQKDTVNGRPYIEHVGRVVGRCVTRREQAVAWLHDVIEDSDIDSGNLIDIGIPSEIVASVCVLTRTRSQEYAEYIAELVQSEDITAMVVKLADLEDHLHADCPDRLRPRYEAALKVVRAGLESLPREGEGR